MLTKRKIPAELIKESNGDVHYKDWYYYIIGNGSELVEEARISSEKVRSCYFVGNWTLIKDTHIGKEIIGDGHIWLIEDLSKAIQAKIGDKELIKGYVVQYAKHNGTEIDYCVWPISIKLQDNED